MTATSEWPLFDGDPGRYIVPGVVAMHAAVPAGSAESAVVRLRAVWGALRRIRIGYAYEPAGPGRQRVRPPGEVLVAPRAGTCLDLALVLAGALEHAGLASAVMLLDPAGDGDGHALTVARVHGERPFPSSPAEFAAALDGPPRDFVAIDPNGLAVSLGATATAGLDTDLDTAVAAGHAMLADPRFTWRPPGAPAAERHRPPRVPSVLPLREIYREPDAAGSVLALVRAEYALTPFQARDELLVLDDFARRVAAGDRTGLAVIHGAGGSGKTRLALELADRFRREGWYAGPLGRADWLAEVTAPLLVVVDYADASVAAVNELLDVLDQRTGPPAVVVATARSIDGDWLAEVTHARAHLLEVIGLDEAHPHPGQVYEHTFAQLRPGPRPPLPDPRPGHTWTTLDLVLFGWLAAVTGAALPATRDGLYQQILDHEQKYWAASWTDLHGGRADRPLLAEAAACLTLLGPASLDAAVSVLTVVEDERWRRDIARTFEICLRQRPGERWAIRPDPIGDHHLLRVLTAKPALLGRWLPPGADEGALTVLQRAGGPLLADAIRIDPDRWRPVLAIAAAQGGPAREALETLAVDHPLPLAELSELLPPGSTGLWRLALLVDERRLAEAPPSDRAGLLVRVARRRSDAGDDDGARAAAAEAVALHREAGDPGLAAALAELAVHDPAGLPAAAEAVELLRDGGNPIALARALNTLANRRFDAGDRAGAVRAAHEALELLDGAADRALTLTNLSRYEKSEATGAEAVAIYRGLGMLPELATALNNLAVRRSERRDHAGALTALDEVVAVRRQLARINPRAFLPELAAALNNHGNQRSNVGDRAGAAAALTEAAEWYQRVGSPADVAMVWNNLAVERSRAGDRAGALEAITAAVGQYRRGGPSYELAGALANLAIERSRAAGRGSALAAAVEAVGLYRELGAGPELATALTVLANRRAENGDHQGALIAASEVFLMRRAAGDEAGLALALNNLATHMADVGRVAEGLEFATEAVDRYRRLGSPSRLAMALHTLAERQEAVGNRAAARAAATEAVALRRQVGTPAELAQSLTLLGGAEAREAAAVFRDLGMRGELAKALTRVGDPEAVAILRELGDPLLLPELGRALAQAPGDDGPREAVAIFRRLGLRADLGRALIRLGGDAAREAAVIFRELGLRADLAEALMAVPGDVAAAREAVDILRTLDDDDHLARALRHLGDARTWKRAVAERGGRLRADHAAWLAARGRDPVAEITRAAAEVSSPEGRRHVWEVALSLGPALGLPADHLAFIDGWLTAPDWPAQAALLSRDHALLGAAGLRDTLRRANRLYGDERLEVLTMLIGDMGERGVDVVLAELERSAEEQNAIAAWKACPSWPESIAHLREHAAILTRPTVRALLTRSGDQLHATVLRLAGRFPLEMVLRILTEPPATAELALRAVEDGDLALLIDLIPACTAVLDLPGDGPFLWAVMLCAAGRPEQGMEVARTAARVMTDLQVRANRIRLRKMLAAPLPPACRSSIEGFLTLLDP